jgi:apolipoprotein N-acyltransferase
LVFSIPFLAFGPLYRRAAGGRLPLLVVGPALWTALEYTRANFFFLAWPWNLLGHTQYQHLAVIQIADWTGVYGVSFLLMIANESLSHLPDASWRRDPANGQGGASRGLSPAGLLCAALAVGLALAYGTWRLSSPAPAKSVKVALIQADVVPGDYMPGDEQVRHLDVYERLSREAAASKPKLIVWPASSLPAPFYSSKTVRFVVGRIAREARAFLLVGGAGQDKGAPLREGFLPFSNTEFLVSPTGRPVAKYNKIKLLPFNEYLPLQGRLRWPRWVTTLEKSFIPGEERTVFEAAGARFSSPICWENLFPDHFRRFVLGGAQFMVSVTNEAFLGKGGAAYQTLAMNVFRAVENRVAVVRASPTGVSAFIAPNGEVLDRVRAADGRDLFVSGILVRDVPLAESLTFYTRHGDIFAFVSAVLGLVGTLPLSRVARRAAA